MDTVTPASAAVRGARLAMSVGGETGLGWSLTPIGKRAVSLIGIIQRGGRPASTLQRQEAIRQETQRGMVVEAWPGAPLEVIEPQFFLELLVALLHLPARFPQTDGLGQRGRRWQIGQRVADRTIAAPLHQQPACFGGRVGHIVSRASHAPAMRWPDAYPRELRVQRSLGALPPTERGALERLGQSLDCDRRRGVGWQVPPLGWAAAPHQLHFDAPGRRLAQDRLVASDANDVRHPALVESAAKVDADAVASIRHHRPIRQPFGVYLV